MDLAEAVGRDQMVVVQRKGVVEGGCLRVERQDAQVDIGAGGGGSHGAELVGLDGPVRGPPPQRCLGDDPLELAGRVVEDALAGQPRVGGLLGVTSGRVGALKQRQRVSPGL